MLSGYQFVTNAYENIKIWFPLDSKVYVALALVVIKKIKKVPNNLQQVTHMVPYVYRLPKLKLMSVPVNMTGTG